MTEKKETIDEKELSKDQLIALLGVYLSEWQHRDELFWMQLFKYFYATLIVIVLPNVTKFLGIELPTINSKLFPIIGMLMGVVFLYVCIGYTMRVKASGKTYQKIMEMIGDEEYQRISIRDRKQIRWGYLFAPPMANVMVVAMFLSLESIAVILLMI